MQQYFNKKNVLLIVIGLISILIIVLGEVSYRQHKKAGEEEGGNKKINCNERCLSLEYISGACRGWAVSENEEMQCESYEKGIGEAKDCQSDAEVKSECCCRTEQSTFSPPTP